MRDLWTADGVPLPHHSPETAAADLQLSVQLPTQAQPPAGTQASRACHRCLHRLRRKVHAAATGCADLLQSLSAEAVPATADGAATTVIGSRRCSPVSPGWQQRAGLGFSLRNPTPGATVSMIGAAAPAARCPKSRSGIWPVSQGGPGARAPNRLLPLLYAVLNTARHRKRQVSLCFRISEWRAQRYLNPDPQIRILVLDRGIYYLIVQVGPH